uniref:Replication protein n=1 Tax=Prunus yellow spot-associated virus TaxID=2600310 RepID=A0A5B9BZU8_9VIRU|nr:replication protein [Prunus yellow spot-associated virus]
MSFYFQGKFVFGNYGQLAPKSVPLVAVDLVQVEFKFKNNEWKRFADTRLRGGGQATDGISSGTNDLSPTMHRDAVTQDIANGLINDIAVAREIAPYAMTSAAVDALVKIGIPASRSFTGSHRHPLHKSIENWILYRVLPNLITGPTAVMWMKPVKFEKLKKKNPWFKKLVNPIITPRDVSRFSGTDTKVGGFSTILMHDAMHYLQPEDVINFFRLNDNVDELVTTIVYPTEVLERESSFFPLVYDLVYYEDGFVYSMEGDSTDCYFQPYRDWVITTGQLVDSDLVVTIERIEGFYGHHVFVLRRGKLRYPSHYMAPLPESVLLPNVGLLDKPERERLVPRELYDKAVHHARNLKSLRPQDAIAKVRSYQHDATHGWVHPSSWEYLTRFVIAAVEVQGTKPDLASELNQSPMRVKLKRRWANRGRLPLYIWTGVTQPSLALTVGLLKGLAVISWPIFGVITGLGFVGALAGSFLLAPPWQSPTEKERRRLAMIYPERFSRMIALKKLDLNKVEGQIWDLNVEEDNGEEFPVYVAPVEVVAKPGTMISDGTEVLEVGKSSSETGRHSPIRYVDKGCDALGIQSAGLGNGIYDDEEEDGYMETGSQATELLCEPGRNGKIVVNIPRVTLKPASVVSYETVEEQGSLAKLMVPNELNQPGEILTKSQKKRLAKKKRKAARKVSENSEGDKQKYLLDEKFEKLVCPTEGISAGVRKLHQIYGVDEDLVHQVYDGPAPRSHLFDGNFEGVPLCLIDSLQQATGMQRHAIIAPLKKLPYESVVNVDSQRGGLTDWHAAAIAFALGLEITFIHDWGRMKIGVVDGVDITIYHTNNGVGMGHFSITKPGYSKIDDVESCPAPGGFYGASTGTKCFSDALKGWRGDDGSSVPFLGFRSYVFKPSRAKPLARDMANGRSGIVFGPNEKYNMGQETQVRWKALVDGHEARAINHRQRVHVAAIYGYPGCGKSWPVAQVLRKLVGKLDFRVSLPTVRLREEWQKMLGLPEKERWRVNTYESTMRKHTEVLVIDEISMMPAGYVDFLVAISPRLRCILILGDVTQTDRFETHPEATCASLAPEAGYWKKFSPFYLGYTRRLSRKVAGLLGVKTYSLVEGFVARRMTRGPEPVITALTGDAKALAELGTGATTFPSSQGSTFDEPVQILMDRAALERCSLGAVHTAVTRSRVGVILIGPLTGGRLKAALANPFWSAILENEPVDWRRIFSEQLEGFKILDSPYRPDVIRGGIEALVEHNFPLDFLPPSRRVGHTLIREELPVKIGISDYVCDEPLPRVTWGQFDAKQLFDQMYKLRPVDAADRLRRHEGELAIQFADDKPEGRNEDGIYPEMIAARHRTKDVTLLPLSVPKRLRFGSPAANKREVLSKFFVGQELFQSYCRLMKLDPLRRVPFDEVLYHSCVERNEWHSLTNKTRAAILANEKKSDPDWVWTFIRIFMKQQRKVNDATLNGPWKAGQTISSMNDQWLLFLGPTIRYMTLLEKKFCPKNLYLHGGRSNVELDDFCRENLKAGLKYANDYTSFDQSQTGEVLASELLYMWHASIPQHIIDLYEENKIQMKCFLGGLKTMRFSGEPATYAFNCRCNMAVMNLQFPLDNSQLPIFVSGDDGGIGGVLAERKSWSSFSQHLSLVAKPEVKNRLLFVGYICTEYGALRDPVPMLARFWLASDVGRLHLIVQSYATELSTGYLMAENVFSVLTDFELDCFFV